MMAKVRRRRTSCAMRATVSFIGNCGRMPQAQRCEDRHYPVAPCGACPSCRTSPSMSKAWRRVPRGRRCAACSCSTPSCCARRCRRSAVPKTGRCCVERLGKRVVLVLGDEFFLVLHLKTAGRLPWLAPGA